MVFEVYLLVLNLNQRRGACQSRHRDTRRSVNRNLFRDEVVWLRRGVFSHWVWVFALDLDKELFDLLKLSSHTAVTLHVCLG